MRLHNCDLWATKLILALSTIALVCGCESRPRQRDSREFFAREHDARIVRQVADHQAALGAQADPTLYRCHFDADGLNAMGRAKLDSMLAGGAPSIYLDSGSDSATAHRSAVSAYLAAAKVPDGSVAIETTAAPHSLSPAAPSMARLRKTESPRATAAANETSANNSGMSTSTR